MADKIIVQPTEQAPVIVGGGNSGTPIKVNTDMDYTQVQNMIDEKIGDIDFSALEQAVAETAKETTLNSAKDEILTAVQNVKGITAKEDTLIQGVGDILEELSKVSDKESAIDELLAIQLETIIGNQRQ